MVDARVDALVRAAVPPQYQIREALEYCAVSGKKHKHHIVVGGHGAVGENIGLVLSVVSRPIAFQTRQ